MTSPFEAVFDVLRGQRLPLDARARKMLRLLLQPVQGCDAVIDREHFTVRWGGGRRHRYFPEIAPSVVSELLVRCGISGPAPHLAQVVGALELANPGGFDSFDEGRRFLWIEPAALQVSLAVRDRSVDDGAPAPLPPELIARGATPVRFVEALPCPPCENPANDYRQLSCGSLVCLACGCSFPARTGA